MFRFSVLSVHGTDPLGRQLRKALNIEKGGLADHSMNDKQEWTRLAGRALFSSWECGHFPQEI